MKPLGSRWRGSDEKRASHSHRRTQPPSITHPHERDLPPPVGPAVRNASVPRENHQGAAVSACFPYLPQHTQHSTPSRIAPWRIKNRIERWKYPASPPVPITTISHHHHHPSSTVSIIHHRLCCRLASLPPGGMPTTSERKSTMLLPLLLHCCLPPAACRFFAFRLSIAR